MPRNTRLFCIGLVVLMEYPLLRFKEEYGFAVRIAAMEKSRSQKDKLNQVDPTEGEGEFRFDTLNQVDDTNSISLFGKKIGSVSRLCDKTTSDHDDETTKCLLSPKISPINTHCYGENGPMPIRPRPWMHSELQKHKIILYYGHHTDKEEKDVQLMGGGGGLEEDGSPWERLTNVSLSLPQTRCSSLHSPSILVDDTNEKLYMYIHGHNCNLKGRGMHYKQPTLALYSKDGIHWSLNLNGQEEEKQLLLQDLFYLSVPVKHGDYFWALGKTQEDGIGSAMLLRSRNLEGPFERGPILARGLRHSDIHIIDSTMYIFFTMIGDAPERILLATIDNMTNPDTWRDWDLLPGPTILSPERVYEHGRGIFNASSSGAAGCNPVHELRDPRLLRDASSNPKELSGLLFYTVQGERAFAYARLSIDTRAYRESIKYRLHNNIDPTILQASSLKRQENTTDTLPSGKTLITGSGRSGTTYLCTLFNAFEIKISHDTDHDCGPYPGIDGAVSWYDGFDDGKRYDHVLHVVRNPLDVIQSRVVKLLASGYWSYPFFQERVGDWEAAEFALDQWAESYEKKKRMATEKTKQAAYRFSVQHWVHRNSFVQRHASWRERVEDLSSDPLADWRLCMAGHFGKRCPNLKTIPDNLANTSPSLNSLYAGGTPSQTSIIHKMPMTAKKEILKWEDIERIVAPGDLSYVQIARQMGIEYGYWYDDDRGNISTAYDCGFQDGTRHWDCWVL